MSTSSPSHPFTSFTPRQFYDILQRHVEYGSGEATSGELAAAGQAEADVGESLWQFVWLAAPAVVVHPLAGLLRNWWCFTWRRTLITSYLTRWNTQLPAIEGASQRVHEDSQRFASGIQSCVSTVLESVLTLIIFCPVLYSLDPVLMGFAVAAAVGGLGVSVLAGWPLVGLEVQNQVVEAELRKKLVILETDPARVIGSVNGVPSHLGQFISNSPFTPFRQVVRSLTRNYFNLYAAFAVLATWLSFYEQIAVIIPYALAASRLFAADPARRLTLGKLVKVSNAFGRVFDSLNVISDRWLQINEWRSCLRRLREFECDMGSRSPARPVRLVATGVELSEARESAEMSSVVDPEIVVVDPDYVDRR